LQFKAISEAYTVLQNDKQRQLYDQFGEAGLQMGPDGPMGGMSPEDLFSQVFGLLFVVCCLLITHSVSLLHPILLLCCC